jgi:hypothetical protein
MTQRNIKTVMEAHAGGLMAVPGVIGVAIGETEDRTPCILVLVSLSAEELGGRVPDTLEGHPVRLFESGEIRPMRGE